MVARPDKELLRGAIDMHAHTHPALFRRPLDDVDLAQVARDYGMRGFVLKDHDSQTTGRAYYVSRLVPGDRAFRGHRAQPLGGRHQPPRRAGGHPLRGQGHLDAQQPLQYHMEYFGIADYPQLGRPKKQLPGPGVTVLDEAGQLTQEALTILDLVAEADVCLATGHLRIDEVRLLQDEAVKRGVREVPLHACQLGPRAPGPRRPARAHGQGRLRRVRGHLVGLADVLRAEPHRARGVDQRRSDRTGLILSSDLGQFSAAPHPEGIRMAVASLLDYGVKPEALEQMMKANPATLLGLE